MEQLNQAIAKLSEKIARMDERLTFLVDCVARRMPQLEEDVRALEVKTALLEQTSNVHQGTMGKWLDAGFKLGVMIIGAILLFKFGVK